MAGATADNTLSPATEQVAYTHLLRFHLVAAHSVMTATYAWHKLGALTWESQKQHPALCEDVQTDKCPATSEGDVRACSLALGQQGHHDLARSRQGAPRNGAAPVQDEQDVQFQRNCRRRQATGGNSLASVSGCHVRRACATPWTRLLHFWTKASHIWLTIRSHLRCVDGRGVCHGNVRRHYWYGRPWLAVLIAGSKQDSQSLDDVESQYPPHGAARDPHVVEEAAAIVALVGGKLRTGAAQNEQHPREGEERVICNRSHLISSSNLCGMALPQQGAKQVPCAHAHYRMFVVENTTPLTSLRSMRCGTPPVYSRVSDHIKLKSKVPGMFASRTATRAHSATIIVMRIMCESGRRERRREVEEQLLLEG